jgi:hypothetical protein
MQMEPARSFTNYPTPSPGDNFIRAVGEYISAVVDVGVDSVWHDGLFFLPNGGSYLLSGRVENYGSQLAQFSVACSLFAASGTPLTSLGSQVVTLAAGNSQVINFAPYNLSSVGSYFFRLRTTLIGDAIPENNTADVETQIYTIPPEAQLTYDDGSSIGAVFTPIVGDGWGMKFDPHQTGSYRIDSVKVAVDTTAGIQPACVQLMAQNPSTSSPGAVLWETVQTLNNGWNAFPANVSTSGPVYVGYLFENGQYSPALSYDNPPTSGECWAKMEGQWVKYHCFNDWMVRVVVDTSSSPGGPQYWVTLAPNGSTIIPAGGDTLFYNISGGNSGASGPRVDFWISCLLPGGSTYGPIVGPVYDLSMQGGYSTLRNRYAYVPGGAPAGNYNLVACMGDYNPPFNVILAADSLSFQKLGVRPSSEAVWFMADGEVAASGTFDSLPQELKLIRAYPNPFNAAAIIRLNLPEASYATLLVYDLTGRVAATLLYNAKVEAGPLEVKFNGGDLPSGVYVCRIEAGRFKATEKIILLK